MTHHHHYVAHVQPSPDEDPTTFWEEKYAGTAGIWSGEPNRALVDQVSGLAPGRALDLGCGEGGDALWLAGRGWTVTGLDLSSTALGRADAAARAAGLADRVSWLLADLADPADWPDEPAYDLVTACFLQTPLEFPRAEVLRRAADRVAPGGRLLVVAHAAPPPWSDVPAGRHGEFPTVDEELADLALDDGWEVEVAAVHERDATGPDGEHGHLSDTVVRVRRR